jgi:transcriptional regulator with XRE-family HTH domain
VPEPTYTVDPIQAKVELGIALRLLRERKGLTQEELGNRLDMDYRYIRRIEKGERSVSWYTIRRFLRCINATLHELADELPEQS